jgi:hypothetical protein
MWLARWQNAHSRRLPSAQESEHDGAVIHSLVSPEAVRGEKVIPSGPPRARVHRSGQPPPTQSIERGASRDRTLW